MQNNVNALYNEWIEKVSDTELLSELKEMSEAEKQEAFFQDLEFGTGGLRGILGAGINRMNVYTVGKVTNGLVNYLTKKFPKEEIYRVAIASDPRNKHGEFVERIIQVLGTNNIEVYVYNDIKPTPLLSYLVRSKKCHAGIMITASHNPKEYNGYKVYNEHGAQLNLEESDLMIKEVNKMDNIFDYDLLGIQDIREKGLIHIAGDDIDQAYLNDIDDIVKNKGKKDIAIVFTPEHGTAYKILPEAFAHFNFINIIPVKEQMIPDGNFTDTKSANPEEPAAYALAHEYAIDHNADLIIANDPDADRLGIMARKRDGEYIPFTGNMTGTLLLDYLIKRDNLDAGIVYKTIVTGELGAEIARKNNILVEETLTGFKFIADRIENNKDQKFLFGYEESYGYLINPVVRDKDAIQASLLIAEMTDYYLQQDLYLDEVLQRIYDEHGYRYEATKSINLSGMEGLEKIRKTMEYYRNEDIADFLGLKVSKKVDYLEGQDSLPKADVIKFYLDEDTGWIVFRPSGTEPKLKVYFSISLEGDQSVSKDKAEDIFSSIFSRIEQ